MPKPLPGESWRGPAKQGDILRAVMEERPRMIVLIDGTFNQTLAVWHKELVYALLMRVICVGAASMGALRAADLHRYGMIGIGEIFARYRDGHTEDEAEVMVTFDPETYRPLSPPPVGSDLKAEDALAAIDFARSYQGKPQTTLDREAITPCLKVIIDRILRK
jgi:hypothetical protein